MPSGLTRESAMTTGGWSCFEDVAAGPIRTHVFRPFITSAFAECVVCGWPKREGNLLSSFFRSFASRLATASAFATLREAAIAWVRLVPS